MALTRGSLDGSPGCRCQADERDGTVGALGEPGVVGGRCAEPSARKRPPGRRSAPVRGLVASCRGPLRASGGCSEIEVPAGRRRQPAVRGDDGPSRTTSAPPRWRPPNATLVDYHATQEIVHPWGGGELASADGLRFVVPVKTIIAGPKQPVQGEGGFMVAGHGPHSDSSATTATASAPTTP
ncbi:Tn3 family transposase [Nonomuraea basaltis]|uniref:Tn3 family transposase n=1 Tax=Nonomuraea basaltis TaxID=2495887 RepID=UPI003B847B01